MSSLKQLKHEQKSAGHQQRLIIELNALVKDIERSEKTILSLNRELEAVNKKYQGPRNTREDVGYLTGLLDCARKKLAWEKQISSLQKRTPALMEQMSAILHDPKAPPTPEMRDQILRALQAIQAAMERMQGVTTEPPASADPANPQA
jgi:hypothetical protein